MSVNVDTTHIPAANSTCNIAAGMWQRAWRTPYYTGLTCPYIRSSQNCQKQGRTDLSYQKYRWVPFTCTTSRLTPLRLLRALRNKLVLVLGDSVSKNLAASIACVLHAAASDPSAAADSAAAESAAASGAGSTAGTGTGTAAVTTSAFAVQPFTIRRGSSAAEGIQLPSHGIRFASVFSKWLLAGRQMPTRKLQYRIDLDKIDQQVVDLLPLADIVVFQATNWWFWKENRWYQSGQELVTSSNADAYAIGLTTLRNFVTSSNFAGKAVVMGVSPSHYRVPGLAKGSCSTNQKLDWNQTKKVMRIQKVAEAFREVQIKVLSDSPIRYVDVLPMSSWRPDGHVARWTTPGGAPPNEKDDCLHWCEGGVTDAWLEMLYNTLLT
ncbi:hypothetical protein CLOM_g1472 [Closterium sp. NIES-68]|nr:hypothetical protein CLOM_g1472 [Closterium sp. NIES-68]